MDIYNGIKLFNEEKFYECHDVLEEIWKRTNDENKKLYQGIIKLAVAFYLIQENRIPGALKLSKGAKELLEPYKKNSLNINIEELINDLVEYFQELENKKKSFPKIELLT